MDMSWLRAKPKELIPPVEGDPLDRTGKRAPDALELEEAKYIRRWRARAGEVDAPSGEGTYPEDLVGLALSGGGIRSATFCLGIMQALAARGLLKKIDCLSTVSGGGYIGSSLTWFLGDKSKSGLGSDPACAGVPPDMGLGKDDFPYGTDDPAPGTPHEDGPARLKLLRYLRQHGYYLTPGAGINAFSLLGIVLRGVFLNLLVWLPAAVLFFSFGLWAAKGLGPSLPFGLDETPWVRRGLAALGPSEDCKSLISEGGIAITPPTSDVACDAAARKRELDATLERAGEMIGFELFLRVSAALAAILSVGALIYAFATFLRQCFPRESEPLWYGRRRRVERLLGKLLPILLVTFVVGSLPIVGALLQGWLVAASPTAMLAGAVALMRHFLAPGQSGRLPPEVLVTAGAALFLYGFVLAAYMIAFRFLPPPDGHVPFELLGLFVWVVVTGVCVNLNHISIHRYYRDRLMETFLPDLCFALANRTGKPAQQADGTRLHETCNPENPWGPYHIINTNVVLVNSSNRTYRDRGGDSFMLSPLFCGSNATGWCPTSEFMRGDLTLPTAVAISGAAANPNTGVGGVGLTRNPVLSLVMSLVNLRLGYWAPNPHRIRLPHLPNHFRPGAYAFGNALGSTRLGYNEQRAFVQLSDGGHFENTGVYELVRRRARLIIACDGGADREFSFSDFQTTVRRIEDDFGARFKVMKPDTPDHMVPVEGKENLYPKGRGFAQQGHMLGSIEYADGSTGTLIYLKTTLIPEVSFKVKGYAAQDADFPDQTTADQFFDETQFEAYRELGYRIASEMLDAPAPGKSPTQDRAEKVPEQDRLVTLIRNRGLA